MAEITPRPGDGRISRADAAALARVEPDTITAWIRRGHLKDVRREGRSVWLNPAEVIKTEHRLHEAERQRMRRVLGAALHPLRERERSCLRSFWTRSVLSPRPA